MGKYRHFSRVSTQAGHFVVLAVDHRSNLLERLNQVSDTPLSDDDFIAYKHGLLSNLLGDTSAVLADPATSIGVGLASGAIHGQMGLLAPVEVTNYNQHPSQRSMSYIPHWSVEKIKLMGGDGVKMLLPYHPDSPTLHEKLAVVRQIVADCARFDLPFFLEPIPFSLDPNETLPNDEYLRIYLAMCQRFADMGVDALKLPFPVNHKLSSDETQWREACEAVTEACPVPWALLSAGVDYDTFIKQTEIACKAGACGVIVGRAVWSEAIELQGDARADFLATTAAERMRELASVCAEHAASWRDTISAPEHGMTWYERYQE